MAAREHMYPTDALTDAQKAELEKLANSVSVDELRRMIETRDPACIPVLAAQIYCFTQLMEILAGLVGAVFPLLPTDLQAEMRQHFAALPEPFRTWVEAGKKEAEI